MAFVGRFRGDFRGGPNAQTAFAAGLRESPACTMEKFEHAQKEVSRKAAGTAMQGMPAHPCEVNDCIKLWQLICWLWTRLFMKDSLWLWLIETPGLSTQSPDYNAVRPGILGSALYGHFEAEWVGTQSALADDFAWAPKGDDCLVLDRLLTSHAQVVYKSPVGALEVFDEES